MLTLAAHAGLRVSELIGLNCDDVVLGTGAHVRCHGKGRKQRAVPLTNDAQAVLATWLGERAGRPHDPLFPTRTGRRLSRDAVEQRVSTHAKTAAATSASLKNKALHPHVLRHSCAMSLLQAGVDTSVIALWLGHADVRSTQPYLHADLTIKEKALALAHAADRHARPLQAPGRPPGLPRRPVTMPISGPARALGTRRLAGTSDDATCDTFGIVAVSA